ncbi:ATP-binding cassette domain-containing protein [Aurantimonas aggregata]|uniref:ATP-binding cassette domain-containing protein n=1 Tax=Aurantimonas aggregata TaxID=2047720 RepID=A0A6L9MJY1_9HYPH|nr:ATP-binding cassette domain-containing protein [Aurantimonas aggregata]NDV87936.1 ATP-binding cassette domain-containing protein [Aurantimonas aggregata]
MKLEIIGLDQHYGSAQTLRGVDLVAESGECVALLGRNGAGKTTILKCLVGLLPPSAGEIRIDGETITDWPNYRRSRAGIGYVPQGREIFRELSVRDNVLAAARAHGHDRDGSIEEMVSLFPVLGEMWKRTGGQLSGGQQQQLALARALVTRPRLLVLDEPTEGIQPSIVKVIEQVILSLKRQITVLLVEQYVDFALGVADAAITVERGRTGIKTARADFDKSQLSRAVSI